MKQLKRIFLNDKFISVIILLNAVIIFLQESNIDNYFLQVLDITCTLIFIMEMTVKHVEYGIKGYWGKSSNRFDGILVLLSLPSLVVFFLPSDMFNFSILLALRLFRVLRFFRVLHIFPNFSRLISAFKLAMRESYAILLSFFAIIIIFALINCALFKNIAPTYFATPLDSIYAIFRICTVEGWYDIPDTVAAATSPFWGHFVRVYFCFILLLGGIIGMSFINSVFVDAMVSDNNDDVKAQLAQMEAKIDKLLAEKEGKEA